MKVVWVVAWVHSGDGKTRVGGVFSSRSAARAYQDGLGHHSNIFPRPLS
jgi:hypothetical protein